jgi:hypothetical protein
MFYNSDYVGPLSNFLVPMCHRHVEKVGKTVRENGLLYFFIILPTLKCVSVRHDMSLRLDFFSFQALRVTDSFYEYCQLISYIWKFVCSVKPLKYSMSALIKYC